MKTCESNQHVQIVYDESRGGKCPFCDLHFYVDSLEQELNEARLLLKILREFAIPWRKEIDALLSKETKCLCGHGAEDHKHLDNCFGPACACTRFKEQPLP